MAPFLGVSGLTKVFRTTKEGVTAAKDVTFDVEEGKLFTLLGPSGCGKSTTLRCIAGLEKPDSGEISIGGRAVFSSSRNVFVPPEKRNVGMVFQSYAIWPHMNVFDNVAYPLKIRRTPRDKVRERVRRVLEVVRLEGLEDRPAPLLSGGQQQRVALARALVYEPKLLLLDEPLSNLDAKLREHMRLELKELQRRLGITTIYVTHDQAEALALSDEVVIMNAGQMLQRGSPTDIYNRPKEKFVADFIGLINFIAGRVATEPDTRGFREIETSIGRLPCQFVDAVNIGEEVLVTVRPEEIRLYKSRPEGPSTGIFEGTVKVAVFGGEVIDYRIQVGDQSIRVRAHPSLQLSEGQTAFLQLDRELCSGLKP